MHKMFTISMRTSFTNQCVKSCLNGTESHQAYLQLPVKLTSAFWAIDSKSGHPGHKIKKELHLLLFDRTDLSRFMITFC